jgi:hypothetical protein
MGLFFAILYPVFGPPTTHLAAGVFATYILGGFLWDWLLTIGWLPAKPGQRYLRLENFTLQYLPIFLRILLLAWGLTTLLPDLLSQGGSLLPWVEAGAVLCLILGIAGRIAAIAALVVLGIHMGATSLDAVGAIQLWLVVVYSNLLFLGTGALSLWPVEDRLIYHRLGDPR